MATQYKFTGKEQDSETGLYYYGARYYDPVLSRWISADPPLATGEYLPNGNEKHDSRLPGMGGVFNTINLNAYQYAGMNPIRFIDLDGRLIKATFNMKKGIVTVTDLDTGVTATAFAFSGNGKYWNNPNATHLKNKGPLPLGQYEVLNHPTGKQKGKTWFALDKKDGYRDDHDPRTKRGQFKLHLGTASDGCITVIDDKSDKDYHGNKNRFKGIFKKYNYSNYKKWKKIESIILKTRTKKVKDTSGRYRVFYGNLKVEK